MYFNVDVSWYRLKRAEPLNSLHILHLRPLWVFSLLWWADEGFFIQVAVSLEVAFVFSCQMNYNKFAEDQTQFPSEPRHLLCDISAPEEGREYLCFYACKRTEAKYFKKIHPSQIHLRVSYWSYFVYILCKQLIIYM